MAIGTEEAQGRFSFLADHADVGTPTSGCQRRVCLGMDFPEDLSS